MNEAYFDDVKNLIQSHLTFAVPLRVDEMKDNGGPSEVQLEYASEHFPTILGQHGDAILFHEKGQTGPAMSVLTETIAILSFFPGGITVFGLTFDASDMATIATLFQPPDKN